MNTISNWEEVPIFDSEEAEALFWSETRPDARLMESAVSGNSESSESVTISLRIDPRMLARIKRLARSRFLNYQSMIKQWLSERMEAEVSQESPMKNQNRNRHAGGFTLVELLVVIAIIGVLAGLIVGASVHAVQVNKIQRVSAEFQALKTSIETYKAKKGYYPPDNPNSDQTNALYYELVGATYDPVAMTYTTLDGREKNIASNALFNVAGVSGLANSSTGSKGDDNFNAENFLQVKAAELEDVTVGGFTLKALDVPVEGGNQSDVNPWHYNSHNPTNNSGGYDLWAEFLIGHKTNIIGNWSAHVIVK